MPASPVRCRSMSSFADRRRLESLTLLSRDVSMISREPRPSPPNRPARRRTDPARASVFDWRGRRASAVGRRCFGRRPRRPSPASRPREKVHPHELLATNTIERERERNKINKADHLPPAHDGSCACAVKMPSSGGKTRSRTNMDSNWSPERATCDAGRRGFMVTSSTSLSGISSMRST